MILAAGLGTRLRPLTNLRAKPALPVRGRPVICLLLEFLARQGCRQVMINLHHCSESIRAAVEADHPADLQISWSEEAAPLGTGGGIRRAASFLREDEACVVLAGDMLLDLPLKVLFDRHVESGRDTTLLLRKDARASAFGSIGVDADGGLTRIGKREITHKTSPGSPSATDHAVESAEGLFTGVRFFKSDMLGDWPTGHRAAEGASSANAEAEDDFVFEDLRDWLMPGIEERGLRVGAEILPEDACVWEPVGTLAEYLRVNLSPPILPTLGGAVDHWSGAVDVRGENQDVIISTEAHVAPDAMLERCVVWDGEDVPSGFEGRNGVYAGGQFFGCPDHTGAVQ